MSVNLKTINIDNNETLLLACDYLHDSSFDISSLSHDKEHQTCSMIFKREFSADPSLIQRKPFFFFFEKVFYPLVESVLTINGVKSVEITDKARIGTYTFNKYSNQGDKFTFEFCENMQIDIILESQPHGSMVDQKFLNKYSRIHTFQFRKFSR